LLSGHFRGTSFVLVGPPTENDAVVQEVAGVALALYRKYRPRTFAEVIGQEHVTEPLSQALRSGRLNHAYLFSGPRGCGKTSSARILARSLNCEQGPTPDPCGVCQSCKSLANDGTGSIDVIEIDAASHGGVDDARELREKAFFAPASSRFKIYVIDEAHMVSSAGFNALLKLVEEPPDYVKFIFATTEPDKVLGTIRSRTHHYPFRLIPPAVLRPYLQQLTDAEGVTVEPSVLPLVVRAGGGSARDSLSILDQLIAGSGSEGVTYARAVGLLGVTDVTLIDEMCDAIATGDGAAAYATIDRVAEAGHEPRRFASDLLERFRDLIILQQVPDAVAKGLIDGPADQLEMMAGQAARLGAATLSRCADILHNGLVEMRGTTAPRLLLELVTARMLLPGADASALLQRLERLERSGVRAERPAADTGVAAPRPTAGADSAAGDGGGSAGVGSHGGAGSVGDAGGGSHSGGGGSQGSGGVGGGGKAAAMAAAAAARAAAGSGSGRPAGGGSARPVSPAAPTTNSSAPTASAPTSPAPTSPAAAGAGPTSSATTGPIHAGAPGSSAPSVAAEPDSPAAGAGAAGAVPSAAGVVPSAGLAARSGPAMAPGVASTAGEPGGHGEPDWNQVADGGHPDPVDSGDYDEEPPWDDEPAHDAPPSPQLESPPAANAQPESRSATRVQPESRPAASVQPESRPAASVQPESRLAAGVQTEDHLGAGATGSDGGDSGERVDERSERVRAAWHTLGQQQPKVRAMQEYGIGIRDVEGDTVVFAAPTQALVDRFLNWREAIATEFRKSPGGEWRIRCEVGEAGPARGPARADGRDQSAGRRPTGGSERPAPQAAAAASAPERNTGRTESRPSRPQRPPAADADEDWPAAASPAVPANPNAVDRPAPARPEASRPEASRPGSTPANEGGGSGWPEPARPGGGASADADTGWPEPARPGGARSVAAPSDDSGWPEPARPGGAAAADADTAWPEPVRPGSAAANATGATARAPGDASAESWPEPARPGAGSSVAGAGPASAVTRGGPAAPVSGGGGLGGGSAFGGAAVPAAPQSATHQGAVLPGATHQGAVSPGATHQGAVSPGAAAPAAAAAPRSAAAPAAVPQASHSAAAPRSAAAPAAPARSAAMEAARAAARTGVEGSSGAAAARAALANARSGGAAPPAGRAAPNRPAVAAGGGAARSWSDAPPVEEAPYDPEYDGPPTAYEGFDPGDEPLDDVIDEKTARQSSEELAMQLLREAFGAEKIAEL
jgi:DNA polymerase-3 subunit gamma/tau